MERFGYNPPPTLNAPELPGLVVHEVDLEHIKAIREMNEVIFKEQRIINSFEREDLMILEASLDGKPVGFKVGYRENSKIFYSAKGGVLPSFRRKGIAIVLLNDMMKRVAEMGYQYFAFDTFPNLHPGMTILAMENGFALKKADYNLEKSRLQRRLQRISASF